MTITIDLQPDVESGLLAQAQAKGVSLTDYVQEIVAREARAGEAEATAAERRSGQTLIDAFADIRGLFTDEEIDRMFARNQSPARPVDLS
jgi:post-segregation antitoxin (ccd killing protein)